MYESRSKRTTWVWFVLIVIISVLMWTVVLSTGTKNNLHLSEEPKDVRAYFPVFPGLIYDFGGEGMEFAPFTRYVKFADDPYVQMHDANGTVVARVFECLPHEIRLVQIEPEFYEEVSLIGSASEQKEELAVILQTPLDVGHVWAETADRYREITAVDKVITVPAGTFHDVIEIKITSRESGAETYTYEYYAKNIGLIKRMFIADIDDEEYIVSSYLEHLSSSGLQP